MGTLQGFLALLMVLIVSGEDEEVTVTAGVDESVLLPCSCEKRDLSEGFKWQKENVGLVWQENKKESNNYTGRVEAFVNSSSSNCSLLLKNIKDDDNGTYRCSFNKGPQYMKTFVHLNVELNKLKPVSQKSHTAEPPMTISHRSYYFVIPVLGFLMILCVLYTNSKRKKRDDTIETDTP